MRLATLFRLVTHILVLDALAALYLTDAVPPAALVLVAGLTAAAWRPDLFGKHPRQLQRFWDLFTLGFLTFAVADLAFLADSIVAALLHLLLFLIVYRLFHAQTAREGLELVLLTFLQLLAASTLTASLGFLLVFCLYVVFGIWAFILWHLTRETELAAPAGDREATGLFTRPFLLSAGCAAGLALVVTPVLFFLIPRIGQAFLPVRSSLGVQTTGFSSRVELGTYGSIQTDPTIVMRVSFPQEAGLPAHLSDLRWRGVALDRFDGRTWSIARSDAHPVRQAWQGRYLVSAYEPGAAFLWAEVFLEPIGTTAVFIPPRLVSIEGGLPGLGVDSGGSLSLSAAPTGRIRYTVLSQVGQGSQDGLLHAAPAGRMAPEVRERYLQLPWLAPRVRALAESLGAGASPIEMIRRIEEYLTQHVRYSLDLGSETGRDPLEDFLFERRTGNCEYFASSLVVLLRAAGIPARVVNGFQRGEWNEVGQYLAVRQRDAHSWAEVYLDGQGWLSVDPTPRAAFEARAFGQSTWLTQSFDALRWEWNRYVVDYSLLDQATFALRLRQRSLALQWAAGRALATLPLARALQGMRRHAGSSLACLGLLAALGWWLWRRRPIRGAWGWLPRMRRQGSPVAFYDRMLRTLARRGHVRSPADTAREFLTGLQDPALHGRAEALTRLYERVRFGGTPLSALEEVRAQALLGELTRRR
jgi:protein-glutamine gamma-glutamyltransferase